MNRLRFISLASGSSGNCYFIGTQTKGILIDAGIGVRTIKKQLKEIGIGFENIYGVFVTHDHADHIKAVGVLGEKYHIPIYSTKLILDGINQSYCVTEKLNGSRRYIEKGETIKLLDFQITAFPVSHDGTDNVGYTIQYNDKRFTIATDLGYINEHAASHIVLANYLVIEANYDEDMLLKGPYPQHLKQRILGEKGHLSNIAAGQFLANNYNDQLEYIYLCHLSKDNNLPEIAYTTIQSCLEEKGIKTGKDVELVTLNRSMPSRLYIFD
jgi:phosphoribosyl 1,2-cyclic phosphodiesterase